MWSLKRLLQLCLGMHEWRMLDSPRLETRCHSTVTSVNTALPLWKFWKCPELLLECCEMLPAKGICYRPWEHSHRLNIVLSAKNSLPVGTQHCRPAKSSCWNLQLPAAEGKQCMAWYFQENVCMGTFPIMQGTLGSMTLETRAINCAFRRMMD